MGLCFDVSDLERLATPETRMVVMNFPHNPTGQLLTKDELGRIVSTCRAAGCWLFSDEMYRGLELHPGAEAQQSASDLYEKAISLSGVSKTIGLPGLRIGWLASKDRAVLQRVLELKGTLPGVWETPGLGSLGVHPATPTGPRAPAAGLLAMHTRRDGRNRAPALGIEAFRPAFWAASLCPSVDLPLQSTPQITRPSATAPLARSWL